MQQVLRITAHSLASLPQRLGSSLVALVGVAGVVAVLVAVLSMARGFEATLAAGGYPDNFVVLRSGSSSELDSSASGTQAQVIAQAPGVARTDGQALVSSELYVMVDLAKKATGTTANVPMRGVGQKGAAIRRDFTIVDGRMFEPGKREIVAGAGAAAEYVGLEVGNTIEFGRERWDVVGVFEAAGGAMESELWADVPVVQNAFRRGNNYSVVVGRLASEDAFAAFKDTLTSDPRLSVNVERESDYYAEQSRILSQFISVIGYGVALLMALGATFGALNTMYTAVSARAREIATLRAIGFSRVPIVVSVMVEAMVLALAGGILGGLIAYGLFNGFQVSTLNFSTFTQVVFAFAVTPDLLVQGIVLAMVIGLAGGLAPAIHAARAPITTALRAN